MWVFCPGRETWARGNTLTGSPGVLTRVRAARGKEWLWEAVPPLSSLSTDYEAGPRRAPLGTPQATHSLPLLCYRICRWGIRLKCEEGCMWETCWEFKIRTCRFHLLLQKTFVLVRGLMKNKITVFIFCVGLILDYLDLSCAIPR